MKNDLVIDKNICVAKKPKRDVVLFVRIQADNKQFISDEANRLGYASDAEYLDALFAAMRKAGK